MFDLLLCFYLFDLPILGHWIPAIPAGTTVWWGVLFSFSSSSWLVILAGNAEIQTSGMIIL